MKLSILSLMVALVVVLEGWSATVKREKVLILTSVNVVDVRAGVVLPKMTVVVRDGKIDAVAKGEFVSHEPGAQVVDATGKYLIPGLWDMHVHSAGGPAAPWDEKVILPLYIANGITGVRDMGGDLDLLQKRRSKIETGELVGPAMVFGGPFLEGGKAQDFTIPINTPEEARQAVDTLERRDVDFIKVLSNVPREAYFAVAEEARKKKLPFVGHVPESVSASEASEAGQRSMEHAADVLLACSSKETELRRRRSEAREQNDGKAYTAAGQEILATYAAGKARSLFAEFVKNDTWQVPTLVWWDATSRLREASLADARLRFVPGWARKEWDPEKLKREITPEHGAALQKATASYIELVREMHRVGVPILAGTDSPDPFVFPGFSLHEELELLVQAGLTPAGALRAATLAPMEFLQRSDRGVVEKGRVADLVLLDGDPLQDIRNTRKIMGVIVGGRYFSRKDLNQMLAQTEASAEAE